MIDYEVTPPHRVRKVPIGGCHGNHSDYHIIYQKYGSKIMAI
jgi:hypothetical protein